MLREIINELRNFTAITGLDMYSPEILKIKQEEEKSSLLKETVIQIVNAELNGKCVSILYTVSQIEDANHNQFDKR